MVAAITGEERSIIKAAVKDRQFASSGHELMLMRTGSLLQLVGTIMMMVLQKRFILSDKFAVSLEHW